ncbi:TPR repeat [Geosmithia morbida]|uniref:TPR repeat n=1 Tax=Geosmithia morbida TaxID=1094350 RepID=A0A9P4YTX4_9HYPO|nr:TPR repeat [Geosmithia morbida]KAF4121618.1 TPR repeat [Geosmithia morbida]
MAPGAASDSAPGELGATFVPGGWDDYYMPPVVAPSPQRVTPQVPQNMQEDLQRMESEASSSRRPDGGASSKHGRDPSLSTWMGSASQPVMEQSREPDPSSRLSLSATLETAPTFSPFPKVKGDNIPPADEEKESILWNARKHVMSSQNVSMQVTWARDVLSWVEVSVEMANRMSPDAPRPSTPRIEHELRVDAVNITTHLASQDHPQALYMQAKWKEFGKFGHRVDKREAYVGYKRSAELGYGRAEYRMGMLFEHSNDVSKAKEHYYKGMALKDSASLYRMGMTSLLGQLGEAKDYQTGLDRIQAAADSADEDSPQGAFVYGMLIGRELPDIYVPDSMLPTNPQTAMVYVEKAAYLGFAKAQHKMGQAYELCQFGCEFNPAYSLHYYGLAANQGNAEAALGVSRWFLFGYEGVFKKNEELAFKYARQASDQKLPTGEFALGYYYEIGIFVEKSLGEARKWYQLAADHGNKDAIGRLESLSSDHTLSKQDHETTTLTRIKSQHGSQRGKRPDRFKQGAQAQALPTLSEAAPPKVGKSRDGSPYVSPQPSPGFKPTVVSEGADFPDPSRGHVAGAGRQPAFGVRVEGGPNPAVRSQSAAPPYPEDHRAPPVGRSASAAPYPEDDMRGQGRGGRPRPNQYGPGPQSDRPGSAFGVAPQQGQGLPLRPMPSSQSTGNMNAPPQQYPNPRGRIASAGTAPPPGGPGPMSPTAPFHSSDYGRPPSSGGYSNSSRPGSSAAQKAAIQGGAMPPGRGYDGRVSQQPPPGGRPPAGGRGGPGPMSPTPQRPPASSYGAPPPVAAAGRVGSAPPGQMQRPDPARPGASASPAPSVSSAPAPSAAPSKPSKGPATFEDMGIPQGKQEGDCVVM